MKSIDPTEYLTIQELADEVNRLGPEQDIVAKGEEVSPRTIRFYVQKKLLPSVRSGPGKKYPYEAVWKVLFVRLLNTRHGLSLNYLRQAMRSVDTDTMRSVVLGEEPLEIASPRDLKAIRRHADAGYQVVELTGESAIPKPDRDWQVLLDSSEVMLKVSADLPSAKMRQMRQIAELAASLLQDDVHPGDKS